MKELTNKIIKRDIFFKYILSQNLAYVFKILGNIICIIIVVALLEKLTIMNVLLILFLIIDLALLFIDRKKADLLYMGYWKCIDAIVKEKKDVLIFSHKNSDDRLYYIVFSYIEDNCEKRDMIEVEVKDYNMLIENEEVNLIIKDYPQILKKLDSKSQILLFYYKTKFNTYNDYGIKSFNNKIVNKREINDTDIESDISYNKIRMALKYILISAIIIFTIFSIFAIVSQGINKVFELISIFLPIVLGFIEWRKMRLKVKNKEIDNEKDYNKEYNIVDVDDKLFALIQENEDGKEKLIMTYEKSKYEYVGTKYLQKNVKFVD